jgi:membrane protease YdiL (CAAX protease family)
MDARRALRESVVATVTVTALISLGTLVVPRGHVATFVGISFLVAVRLLAWREDDARIERMGLSLGGLMLSQPLSARRLLSDAGRSLLWAAAVAALVFPPFFFGWRLFWKPAIPFSLWLEPGDVLSEIAGQLLLVALPEEAFYRGYLQSRLDEVWPPRLRLLGADVGPGLLVTSAVFAVGHFLTIPSPARLAVFFPSLLFGWLRARTGGIGASVVFHTLCNLYSAGLGRGYGLY